MKLIKRIIISLVLGCLVANTGQAAVPNVTEHFSKKNIKFWTIEDNYLPIVSLKIIFSKSGAAYDPDDKFGLANMTASMLTEGAGGMTGTQFMQRLEELATSMIFNVDADNFYVHVTCLKENLDESLKLLAMSLMAADFTTDAILRVQKNIETNMIHQQEDPEGLAAIKFQENFFGNHPYARQVDGTKDAIKTITKQDLKAFVLEHFALQNMQVSVAGSIGAKQFGDLLDKYLAKLPTNTSNNKEVAEFIPADNLDRIIKIEQNIPQSVIMFGMPGPKRSDADFYNTYLANHVIGGGGFEARLMKEIREKRGLVYNVYSSLQTYHKAGLIMGSMATKNESAAEAIKLLRGEVDNIHRNGVTIKELTDSQDYLVGSFPLRMTRNASLAAFLGSMQLENLGLDFLEKRNDYIKAVSEQQLNLAAQQYFDTKKMLIVVVGK